MIINKTNKYTNGEKKTAIYNALSEARIAAQFKEFTEELASELMGLNDSIDMFDLEEILDGVNSGEFKFDNHTPTLDEEIDLLDEIKTKLVIVEELMDEVNYRTHTTESFRRMKKGLREIGELFDKYYEL